MNKGWFIIGLLSAGFIWAVSNSEQSKKLDSKPKNQPKKTETQPKKVIL